MAWEVRLTLEAEQWFKGLSTTQASRVARTIDRLSQFGPSLGRPRVDHVKRSRHQNMKELRVPGTTRCLFAFDHRGQAIVLVGGSKRSEGNRWYERHVGRADRLLDAHLRDSGQKGTIPWRPEAGRRSAQRDR
jgi:hypothetical protein